MCKDFFDINITALGQFELSKDILEHHRKDMFVSINAPAIMFPYVRAFITTLTSNVGSVMGSVTLPPQVFSGGLEEVRPQYQK